MKVWLINGSPRPRGNTYHALAEVEGALNGAGVETELLCVGAEAVRGCIACGKCSETGRCVFDDCVNRVAARLDEFDGFVFGTPVYYASIAGGFKCFLDRLFYSAGAKLAYKPAAGVACARRGGLSATYDQLNKYFGINCMPIVSSTYWNQAHGGAPGEALRDEEGMQVMRTLGRNMAWMLKCVELGKQSGAERPPREEPTARTNFIR